MMRPLVDEDGLDVARHEPWALRISSKYLRGLHAVRYPLLITWLIVTLVLGMYAIQFPSDVSNASSAPEDSQAYSASVELNEHFPMLLDTEGMILFARALYQPFNFGLDPRFALFDYQLTYWLYTGTMAPLGPPTIFAATWMVSSASSFFSCLSYGLPTWVAESYLGQPGNYSAFSTITLNLTYQGKDAMSDTDFAQKLTDTIQELLVRNGLETLIVVSPLGLPSFLNELNRSTSRDMGLLFGLFTPLALVLFAVSLGSVRILLLPLCALCATVATCFSIMHFVSSAMTVDSTAPGVAGLLCLSLSLSYAYTFAAKFHRETLDQRAFGGGRAPVVMQLSLAYSGRTIFVSGITIAFCSLGVVVFPVSMLRAIGVTSMVSALCAVLVSLNLLPIILLCCPDFFARGIGPWVWPRFGAVTETLVLRPRKSRQHHQQHQQPPVLVEQSTDNTTSRGPHQDVSGSFPDGPSILYVHPRPTSSADGNRNGLASAGAPETVTRPLQASSYSTNERFFYKYFVAFLCQWQVAVPAVVIMVGLSMYPITQADQTNYSNNIDQFVPRDSTLLPEFNYMSQSFRAGEVFQYYMVMKYNFLPDLPQPNMSIAMLSLPQTFTVGQSVLAELVSQLNTAPEAFDAFFYAGNRVSNPNISQMEYISCLYVPNTADCRYLAIISGLFVAGAVGPYTWVQVRLSINPLSEEGRQWYQNWKQLAPVLEEKYNVNLWLQGYAADSIDTVTFADSKFPVVVGIVLSMLFVAIGVLTLSIGIPLRALATVGVTWATTAGLANLVFGRNAFSWFAVNGLQGSDGAVAWFVPFTTVMLVTGLSMHYDLTLVLRVQQFYHHGFDTPSAIVLAAQETGSEVTVGATMMMLVFTSLLLSQVPVMNQLAFYLFVVALLQGLVYRLFLSTTFMSLLDEWNWFPYNLTAAADTTPIESLVGTEAHIAAEETVRISSQAARRSQIPADTPRDHSDALKYASQQMTTPRSGYGATA